MNDTHNDFCHIAVAASIRLTSALKNDFISFHQPSIPTETNWPHELKEDYPTGNLILREDCQKSFKKEVWWMDIKSFLRAESIGEVYRSYNNGEKDRYVCLSSQNGIHDVFDRLK